MPSNLSRQVVQIPRPTATHPTLQKILGLQSHQFIRWGTTSGRVLIATGLPLGLMTFGGFRLIANKLHEAQSNAVTADLIASRGVESIEDIRHLRKFSRLIVEKSASSTQALMELVLAAQKDEFISAAGFGATCVVYGMLLFRAKELAMEAGADESPRGGSA